MDRRSFIKVTGAAAGSALIGRKALAGQLIADKIPASSKPNILLIMTDQQSADIMSWNIGRKYINTPNMDSLAENGTIFTRAYSANPLCVPCRTSLFTGHYPHQTGVETNSDIKLPVAEKYRNMGAIFRDAGYDTGYLGKWHMAYDVKDTGVHGFEFMRTIKNNGTDIHIPAGADEFLNIKREKPFLLVTSFVNPHNICEWPRNEELPDGPIGVAPAPDECPPALQNGAPMKSEPDIIPLIKKSFQSNPMFPVGDFDENKWRQYRWAYFRMIEKVDALIGKVIESLKNSGQYDNTVIVFTSDHGDMQGAHGWNQKTVLFEESVHISFIINQPSGKKKVFNENLVNTGVDTLPTLCAFAGISLSPEYPGLNVLGREAAERKYIVSENKMIQGAPVDGVIPEPAGRMVRSGRYKYCIYDMGERNESLVDLESDPGETLNLAENPEYTQILDHHRKYLAEWCKNYGDGFLTVVSKKINK